MITSRRQNVIQNQSTVIGIYRLKMWKVQISGSNGNKYKRHSQQIKRRINLGNSCCYPLDKILSPRLLSKKLKVNIYNYYITGCIAWS